VRWEDRHEATIVLDSYAATTACERMNPPDSEPMMSLDMFTEQMGLSKTTIWRFRKRGMLTAVNICGRQYISRSEIARFNARATAGEFAKMINPRRPK